MAMSTMTNAILVLVLLVSSVCAGAQQSAVKIDPQTGLFKDADGAGRLFRGVNAVYKIPPYHPTVTGFDTRNTLSPQDADMLRSWGFNVVRLGAMWPGLEWQRGVYNETYLDALEQIVNNLAAKGIYTILDCHQDLLSPKFCGEGVPDWAAIVPEGTKGFPWPVADSIPHDNSTGYPLQSACHKHAFAAFYAAEATEAAFLSLYNNTDGIRDSFANFWKTIATRFANNTNVLGYELLNEPIPGNAFKHPSEFIPGYADKHLLFPMYRQIHEAIRTVDDEHIIFFEPTVFDIEDIKHGFPEGPGGASYNDRQAYAFHIYCPFVNKSLDPRSQAACDWFEKGQYRHARRRSRNLGGGSFLTEFGASYENPPALEDIDRITALADENLESWTWWMYKDFQDITTASYPGFQESFWDKDGKLQEAKVRRLSRAYAQSVQGIAQSMTFDPASAVFTLTYEADPSLTNPTRVFISDKYYYPQGVCVDVVPAANVTMAPSEPFVFVAAGTQGKTTITISPKGQKECGHKSV